MTCPICRRLYCDHTLTERGQSEEEMIEDMYAPHIIDSSGSTRRVGAEEYERHTGRKWTHSNDPKKDNPESKSTEKSK